MKKFLAAATIALSLTAHAMADPEPAYQIVARDAKTGTIKVRLAADLCGPTDTEVEEAIQALFNALSQVPEVYENAEVVNTDCQVEGVFSYTELENILREMGE